MSAITDGVYGAIVADYQRRTLFHVLSPGLAVKKTYLPCVAPATTVMTIH